MEFKSLMELATHLSTTPARQVATLQAGLERCAKRIEEVAKKEIGHYQDAVGPFQEWAELAEATEEEKAARGYPTGAPLQRTGEMRDAIKHEVKGLEAVIGATDTPAGRILVYHEFGTARMPARPVLGPAAFRSKEFIIRTIGAATVAGLIGQDLVHPALGYSESGSSE